MYAQDRAQAVKEAVATLSQSRRWREELQSKRNGPGGEEVAADVATEDSDHPMATAAKEMASPEASETQGLEEVKVLASV